ncbi:MAG: MJ1477/TM1410 family putative glycoside hydrolase [Bacteroidota bacterium]
MKKLFYLLLMLFPVTTFSQLQSLMNIKTWAYQLQGINIAQIAADTSFDLIIIDYSIDGTDEGKFTPQEITQIRNSGKKVISYLSIGEAEDYRYYWQSSWSTSPPSWLGPENPDWAGNYKVRFWDPQWQSIIFSYVDTIIAQGFDGIYMDIVDAYYYWMVDNPEEPYADTLMMNYIENIRSHITSVTGNTDFIMIPQNAEDIINSDNVDASQKAAYFNTINACGVEDVFCYGGLDEDNPFNPDTYRIGQLQEWLSNSKQVFSIEYLTQPTLINQYITAAHAQNFVPYVCMRALDQLCPGIPVGIVEFEKSKFSVMPNPSDGHFFIYGDFSGDVTISVYSHTGACLIQYQKSCSKAGEDGIDIDISDFSEGFYYVKLQNENNTEVFKIFLY